MNVAQQLKALRQRKEEIRAAILTLNAKVAAGQSLTDDDKTQLATLNAQAAEVASALTLAEEANEAIRAEAATESARRGQDGDTAASARAAAGAGVVVGQDRSQLDPKRGFKSHADQMAAIIRAGETGHIDPRLAPLAAAGTDEQGGHTNPHGAFLLAPAFAPDLLSVQAEVDPTAGLTRPIPMQSDRIVLNARVDKNHASSVSGGLTVSRTPQTVAASQSRMEFENVELVVHDLCGVGIATNRILQTSPISFMALLQSGFRDEFASKMLDEKLNGTGVSEFQGIIGADATITVAKETGQAADSIVFENVNNMRARQWRYGQSIWMANHDTLPQVTTLTMPIGTGGQHIPIYAPGNDEAAPQGRLLGRPIFFTEFCRKLGDKGDIINAVWSEYLVGTLGGGIEESSSIHVRFLNREQVFMFVVANDGKPWWRSALDPKYSDVTLSPFVTLAARA